MYPLSYRNDYTNIKPTITCSRRNGFDYQLTWQCTKKITKKTKAEFQTAVSTKIAIADCSLKIGQDAITHFSTQTLVHTVLRKQLLIRKYPKIYKMCQGLPVFLSRSVSIAAAVTCSCRGVYQG